jgi:Protein of unknown function (DUF2815)
MADNVITPEFRAAFVGLFKATAPKDNPNGAKKYSIRAVFMPDADLSSLKQQAKNAAEEKWGAGKVPKTVRSPFRFNEELENPIPGIPDDAVVMTFSANEDRRPGVVDKNLQDIIDDAECYSGAWFRAQVRAYAYDQAGNKGVSFGLQNVQKTKDDEPLGKGRIPASKAFEAFGGGESKTAAGMFD